MFDKLEKEYIPAAAKKQVVYCGNSDEKEKEKDTQWVVSSEKEKYYKTYFILVKSKFEMYFEVDDKDLETIWALSHIDGRIESFVCSRCFVICVCLIDAVFSHHHLSLCIVYDSDQLALALWLIDFVAYGNKLPASLTPSMIPPSKRHLVEIRDVDAKK